MGIVSGRKRFYCRTATQLLRRYPEYTTATNTHAMRAPNLVLSHGMALGLGLGIHLGHPDIVHDRRQEAHLDGK